MFGRRNPNAPTEPTSANTSTSEGDIDLDLLPELPAMLPPRRREPAPEPPPSEPAWHASATPPPPERPVRTPGAPQPYDQGQGTSNAPSTQATNATSKPADDPVIVTQTVPTAAPGGPTITLPRYTNSAPAEKPALSRPKTTAESVIGPDDFFDGRYRSERGVRIQGHARGSIESRQYIYVESGADVEADLEAEDITVAGNFTGKIVCRRKLEIASTGKVHGQITTAVLIVQEGGLIDGELHMQDEQPHSAA